MSLWNFVILISILNIETESTELRGPVFRIEPTSNIEFLNINGIAIECSADGVPYPKISWHTGKGGVAGDIPGFRYISSNGTLVFPAFEPTDYNKHIHNTYYQCSAANVVGSIISRKAHVRGVIKKTFNPEVNNVYVGRGDTAVLICRYPVFVENYVSVDSWIRNDDYVLKKTDKKQSHTVLSTGELLIYETKDSDSDWSYRCQTRNRLTGELILSTTEGKIYITDLHSSSLPRVIFKKDKVQAEEGSDVRLSCVAQGNPSPTYRWMKEQYGVWRLVEEDTRIRLVQGTLNIQKVFRLDAGRYLCIVENSIGESTHMTSLRVKAPLSVHLLIPLHHMPSIGQLVHLICYIHGYPVYNVSWKRDGVAIIPSERVQILSRDVLHISSLQEKDKGMYQCFVSNDIDSAQGTAELKISVPPEIFIHSDQGTVAEEGENRTLVCRVVGEYPITISWQRDNSIVEEKSDPRYIFRNISMNNETISELQILNITRSDTGNYTCVAVNDKGRGEASFHFRMTSFRHFKAMLESPRNATSIYLTWTKTKGATEYIVQYRNDDEPDEPWKYVSVNGNEDHFLLTNLNCSTRYHIFIIPYNSFGSREPNDLEILWTTGEVPKDSITIARNVTSVQLIFSASWSSICKISYFIVAIRLKSQSQWKSISRKLYVPIDVHVFRQLSPDTNYVITVEVHSHFGGVTGMEYPVRTLPDSKLAPTSALSLKTEMDLAFFKNITIVVYVAVSFMALLGILFAIFVCFRKYAQGKMNT